MLTRAVTLAVALSAGCLGFGAQSVVPGPQSHHFRHGAALAMRIGMGGIDVAGRDERDAAAIDLRAEYSYVPMPELGLTAALGWQGEWATDGADDVSRSGPTFAVVGTLVPVRPFVLRLGGFLQPSTTTVDELDTDSISRGVMIGPGIVARFRSWHYVVSFDWQLSSAGPVLTADGPRAYDSDQFLLNLVLVRWDRSVED